MSLVRAFTTRRAVRSNKSSLDHSASHRPKISGPIELISTTNTLAYEAPDIIGTNPINCKGTLVPSSSSNSLNSLPEYSDSSSSTAHRSGGTFSDASSFDESPISSPEPNHLSCYFKPSVYDDEPRQHSRKTSHNSSNRSSTADAAPVLPQRAPSHSKHAHQLSHKRSLSRTRPAFQENTLIIRDSSDFFRASGPSSPHPFSKELEQLSEVVEEFGGNVRDLETDGDLVFMEAHDLGSFSATDYMMEIADMLNIILEEEPRPCEEAGWI
jgi:hypothetical protein